MVVFKGIEGGMREALLPVLYMLMCFVPVSSQVKQVLQGFESSQNPEKPMNRDKKLL